MNRSLSWDERGTTLVEQLVVLALLAIALSGFLLALSTGLVVSRQADDSAAAEYLARSQLEYTKDYTYTLGATSYPAITPSQGYSISVAASSLYSDTIQVITVTVSNTVKTLFQIEGYKVKRVPTPTPRT